MATSQVQKPQPNPTLTANGRNRLRRPRDDGSAAYGLENQLARYKIIRLTAVALFSVANCVIIASITANSKDVNTVCVIVEGIIGALLVVMMGFDDYKFYNTKVNNLVNHWKHIATRDSLTGLYNRLAFLQALDRRIAIASTTTSRYGVMFIDLNKFKPINDRYGHAVGDNVLTIAARRLLSVAGNDDLVARLGGDEFAILMTRTNVVIARKLEFDIENVFKTPITINGSSLVISASIGTCLASDYHRNAEDVIHAADVMMYRQKAIERWNGNTRINKAKVQGVNRAAKGRW